MTSPGHAVISPGSLIDKRSDCETRTPAEYFSYSKSRLRDSGSVPASEHPKERTRPESRTSIWKKVSDALFAWSLSRREISTCVVSLSQAGRGRYFCYQAPRVSRKLGFLHPHKIYRVASSIKQFLAIWVHIEVEPET